MDSDYDDPTITYKVIWTESAHEDLQNVADAIFSISYWPPSVRKWVNAITNSANSLNLFPMRNSNKIYKAGRTFYRINVRHKYKIYYEIDTKRRLVTIRHIIPSRAQL